MPQHELHMLGFSRTSFPGAGSGSPQQMQMAGFTLLVSQVHISLLHPSFQIERSYKKFSHLAQAVQDKPNPWRNPLIQVNKKWFPD